MLEPGYYNMDGIKALAQFPDNFFEIAVVDPPYGRGYDGGNNRYTVQTRKDGTKRVINSGDYKKCDWDRGPPGKEYFQELIRVSQNQIIFGCNYFDFPLPGGRIVWDKCNDGSDQSGRKLPTTH